MTVLPGRVAEEEHIPGTEHVVKVHGPRLGFWAELTAMRVPGPSQKYGTDREADFIDAASTLTTTINLTHPSRPQHHSAPGFRFASAFRESRRKLALYRRQVNNDWMGYSARVASSVQFVAELDRSVNFYRDLFGCEVSLYSERDAALLLTPGGFQLYLIERDKRAEHYTSALGHHLLMWATDTAQGLKYFEQTLKEMGRYTETHTSGKVTFVEGRDPDGIRVIVAHPDPSESPRSVFDSHLYS